MSREQRALARDEGSMKVTRQEYKQIQFIIGEANKEAKGISGLIQWDATHEYPDEWYQEENSELPES